MFPFIRLRFIRLLCLIGLLGGSAVAQAAIYPLGEGRLIGSPMHVEVPDNGGSLEELAAQFQVGLYAMLAANPGVDPFLPRPGRTLTIPSQLLLPDVPRKGIVINLAELRLYYFPEGEDKVYVYPIGIGRVGRETPEMETRIVSKQPDPVWIPPASIRAEHLAQGDPLPERVEAGPDNPLGKFAMRMAYGHGEYLIHGTNKNFGVGLRVSAGCIRLRAPDIEQLFNMVPVGTPVRVINQPVLVSQEPDGRRWIEVHQPLSRTQEEYDGDGAPLVLSDQVQAFINFPYTDLDVVDQALLERSGMPVVIGWN
ncbi:L,D-transpeptidase family protein [Pseudaeromonas paramecii]|uniref:L,D-transpeptidase family protein n=1 Tax=Pseudaeromonas paramecii TaxID=2138166 RepID=A0ABP8QJ75_9GAMM